MRKKFAAMWWSGIGLLVPLALLLLAACGPEPEPVDAPPSSEAASESPEPESSTAAPEENPPPQNEESTPE